MTKLLAAIVASTFAFASAGGFAADYTSKKKEELTKEERMEMRSRADRLIAERTQGYTHAVGHSSQMKKHHAPKKVKKAGPKA